VATDPAVAIDSARLGAVQVQLSGTGADLAVSLAAAPQSAPLIDAAAPRLQQDLAQAGITLSALSVNGQRSDLGQDRGQGGRNPRRPLAVDMATAPLRRTRSSPNPDRFA